MFDLEKMPSIIHHLELISKDMFVDKGSHYMFFCPFCDDATRKANPNHGHCYISKSLPVFYCHRCNIAGSILKLLIHTDFEDTEILTYLKSFIKYNFVKDYIYDKPKQLYNKYYLYKTIYQQIKNISQQDITTFNKYLYQRLGSFNYINFLLYPTYVKPFKNNNTSVLTVGANNSFNNFISARLINPIGKVRYYTMPNSWYFFQEFRFNNITDIIITEGFFDLLNIYLYTNYFSNGFYISCSGKNYLSVLESLILQELLIGKYNIHFILDNDNKYYNFLKNKGERLINILNNDLTLTIWKPISILNDTGDYPLIEKV